MSIDEKSFYRDVGRLLQARRRAFKMTQAQLAEASGIRRTSIANIEAGRQTVPLHVLYQLASALEMGIEQLAPPWDPSRKQTLVVMEIDGRSVSVPRRAADFLARMREEKNDTDSG